MTQKQKKNNLKPAEKKEKKRTKYVKGEDKKNGPIKSGTRKAAVTSVQGISEIVRNAEREIQPPNHVRFRTKDYLFFDEIIEEFATIEWTEHAISIAALLARAMTDFEKDQHIMRKEGGVLTRKEVLRSKNDEPDKVVTTSKYINPRKALLAEHSKIILQMRRSLALHARGKDAGETRDIVKRRALAKRAEQDYMNAVEDDEDDLLAKPTIN